MRFFVAIVPPAATRQTAFEVLRSLRRPNDGMAWVKEANLHFTLRFLGELDDEAAARAGIAAREVADRHAPFEAEFGAVGAFPDARRARVLWLGLARGADAIGALARTLEDALERNGFERDARAFSPHLTLGRVRGSGSDWRARLDDLAAGPPAASFTVERITLIESRLARGGSIYTVREEAVLARV